MLYYARAVYSAALVAIDSIFAKQSKAIKATNDKITRLLNYFATHPNTTLRYHASDMQLYFHSDASYLSEPKSRSRIAGHSFLSRRPSNPDRQPLVATDTPPPNNGAIHTNSTILKVVVASAAKSETGGMVYSSQDAVPMRAALHKWAIPRPRRSIAEAAIALRACNRHRQSHYQTAPQVF